MGWKTIEKLPDYEYDEDGFAATLNHYDNGKPGGSYYYVLYFNYRYHRKQLASGMETTSEKAKAKIAHLIKKWSSVLDREDTGERAD